MKIALTFMCLGVAVTASGVDGFRVLKENCLRCHGEQKRKGGLIPTSREMALKGGDEGKAIDLEKPGDSLLLELVQENGDPHMPPKKQLAEMEIHALKKWLVEGAEWNEEILAELPERKVKKWRDPPKGFHPVGALATSPDGMRLAIGRSEVVEVFALSEKDANRTGIWTGHRDEVRRMLSQIVES